LPLTFIIEVTISGELIANKKAHQMTVKLKLLRSVVGLWSSVTPKLAGGWLATKFLTVRPAFRNPPEEFLHPAATRLKINDEIEAWRYGPQSEVSTKTALLVHGWEGRRSQFSEIIPALLNQGYDVICLDPPMHGSSEGKASNPVLFGDAVLAAGEKFGRIELVVGHSLGGVGVVLAMERGLEADQYVLISTPSKLVTVLKGVAEMVGFSGAATRAFVEEIGRRVGTSPEKLDLSLKVALRKEPALFIHDKGDRNVPFDPSWGTCSAWPGAIRLETSGFGHNRILVAPEVVTAIAKFAGKMS
jgi:hypothetical protein